MKKWFVGLGIGVIILSIGLISPCNNQLFAQAGCCKERSRLNGKWSKNGMNLSECEAYNSDSDGDDYLKPQGFVWWDLRCS